MASCTGSLFLHWRGEREAYPVWGFKFIKQKGEGWGGGGVCWETKALYAGRSFKRGACFKCGSVCKAPAAASAAAAVVAAAAAAAADSTAIPNKLEPKLIGI